MAAAHPPPPPAPWRRETAWALSQIGRTIFSIATALLIHQRLYGFPGTPKIFGAVLAAAAALLLLAAALARNFAQLGSDFLRAAAVGCLGMAAVEIWYFFSRRPPTLQHDEKLTLVLTLAYFAAASILEKILTKLTK